MWSARCRMLHPGRTTGIVSRKVASDEYAEELKRTEMEHLPASKMLYKGLPSSKKKELLGLWLIAFPTREDTFLDRWLTKTPDLNRPRNKSGGRREERMKHLTRRRTR